MGQGVIGKARATDALLVQGYETFESCFRSCTGRNILPYSTSENDGTLMQWLSPMRRSFSPESIRKLCERSLDS